MNNGRKERLPKVSRACDTCRTRKTRCDGCSPCTNCVHHGFSCAFSPLDANAVPKKRKAATARLDIHHSGPQAQHTAAGSNYQTPISPPSSATTNHVAIAPSLKSLTPEIEPRPSNALTEHDVTKTIDDLHLHAESREFHGPSGILSFLSNLRAKAHHVHSEGRRNSLTESVSEHAQIGASLASYLQDHELSNAAPRSRTGFDPSAAASKIHVQKTCVLLYFQNLHLIHPILHRLSFFGHCERSFWGKGAVDPSQAISERHFAALYLIVAALGAITAAVDAITIDGDPIHSEDSQRLAETFFELSKRQLGNVFESTSIDSTATTFLMAVYCQNALRPHSNYLYNGMAVRSSFALGVPTSGKHASEIRRLLWWALYSHELEMSSSIGRLSALNDPALYTIGLPNSSPDSPEYLIGPMVSFAAVIGELFQQLYHLKAEASITERSAAAMGIDRKLHLWKSSLPTVLNPNATRLNDPEWRLKQKIVLDLRFHNAQILLHRPFILLLGEANDEPSVFRHAQLCINASVATINLLNDAYLNRPYFRTWWYNTTYLLYGVMVILYVLLWNKPQWATEDLLETARRGLSVLHSMSANPVARRCASVVEEVLNITDQMVAENRARSVHQANQTPHQSTIPLSENGIPEQLGFQPDLSAWAFQDDDLLNNLVDPMFLDSLLDAGSWLEDYAL